MIGTRIGPYSIKEKNGEGGMGVIYRNFATRLFSPVAIKILLSTIVFDKKIPFDSAAKIGLHPP